MSFSEPLPLTEYFEMIEEHLRARHELADLSAQLEQRAHQFRVIEKRLLLRLKDRNPAPLASLELLFQGTYAQLMDLARATENAQESRSFQAVRLSAGTRLLLMLCRLRFALDDDAFTLLEAHLSPLVIETEDQGWEERTTAALAHLLRSSLAKAGKEAAGAAAAATSVQATLARPADAQKLKKNITLVCDRLNKGVRPKEAEETK